MPRDLKSFDDSFAMESWLISPDELQQALMYWLGLNHLDGKFSVKVQDDGGAIIYKEYSNG